MKLTTKLLLGGLSQYRHGQPEVQGKTGRLPSSGGAKPVRAPMSYEEIKERVKKVLAESYNCGDNIARSNWVYNVVELKEGLTADSLFEDMNFSLYITDLNPELYDIRFAAIDMC